MWRHVGTRRLALNHNPALGSWFVDYLLYSRETNLVVLRCVPFLKGYYQELNRQKLPTLEVGLRGLKRAFRMLNKYSDVI